MRRSREVGAPDQMIGRRNDRGAVADVDEQAEAFAVAGEPDRARRHRRRGGTFLQQRNTPERPVQIRANLAERPLERLLDRITLVRSRCQTAQQAHLRVLVLQLEAVLQFALVGPRQPVRVRKQGGGHRLEGADQRVELVAATGRGAAGEASRQLLGPLRELLHRCDQVAREVKARRDRRQDREQHDRGKRVGRVAQLAVGMIVGHQHGNGQRFGQQRQRLERDIQRAVQRDGSAVAVLDTISDLVEPARVVRRGRARERTSARNQADVETDAARQPRDVLGANAVLRRHRTDDTRACMNRNHSTQVQAFEPFFRRKGFAARQRPAYGVGLASAGQAIPPRVADPVDQLAARVVDLGDDVAAEASCALRPHADGVVGVSTVQRRHQVGALRQRPSGLLDAAVLIEDRSLHRRRAALGARALLRHEQRRRAAVMEVVADADRPAGNQHEHADHRQCDRAEARVAARQHDGMEASVVARRCLGVGGRRPGTTRARIQQATKSLQQGGSLGVRHGRGASGRTGQAITAG